MNHWQGINHLLCVRPDNMGDVIMSGPAIRALRESFGCRITLLTSSLGAPAAGFMPEIDDVIISDLPWVRATTFESPEGCLELIEKLKQRQFDAAVVFTVYSQSALPSAMLAFLAQIPLRAAYCRENPYGLLTHWIPDSEPYTTIQHQVLRDLQLVQSVGANVRDDRLLLAVPNDSSLSAFVKEIIQNPRGYILVHPSVSEKKRTFPLPLWAQIIRELKKDVNLPIVFTGVASDVQLAENMIDEAGLTECYNVCGATSVSDFYALINKTALVLSVNTSAVHIAAAYQTPVVVLYALTNPQHTPWKSPSLVFYFDIPAELQSRNAVIRYVSEHVLKPINRYPHPVSVAEACKSLLQSHTTGFELAQDARG